MKDKVLKQVSKHFALAFLLLFFGISFANPPATVKLLSKPEQSRIGEWQLVPMSLNTAILYSTVTGLAFESLMCPWATESKHNTPKPPIYSNTDLLPYEARVTMEYGQHCWVPMATFGKSVQMEEYYKRANSENLLPNNDPK